MVMSPHALTPSAATLGLENVNFTPKHGSWLDMAESELGLASQCLNRRIADKTILAREVTP
jgi:hypothetical protein